MMVTPVASKLILLVKQIPTITSQYNALEVFSLAALANT